MFSLVPDLYAMAPKEGGKDPGMMGQLVLFGSIFLIFFFLVVRPQQKKAKAQAQMIDSLEVGDEVVTAAGIYGKIKKKYDDKDFVELEIAHNTVIKIKKDQLTALVK
ncbi:MAG: preprotein translocase subunit YajC [Candidatus Lambdaproteobacteria bacterium RIFOXYD2_FULL_50_16]|uniref:Sec translocon accessory complex subunit YajC n=1 Tax=Candidatus Lambdaproteobacteria bacterium RIFOXYD2_FULL_50_16 TaxID=1817772 RepID=A0A1F6G576_9PROT|nr:MAG: preprotein translocase subunit YajC [Candidatus Lambdaproteobacteria bacterium RIFOXYD2_FULL_50_16]